MNDLLEQPITPRQLKFIQAVTREMGLTEEMVQAETQRLFGKSVRELNRTDASHFIDRLQSRRPATELAS